MSLVDPQYSGSRFANFVAWGAALFVAWGAWNAQSDSYPFNEQQARPSFYVYGWPLIFGHCSRSRIPIADFDSFSLAVNILASAVLVASTFFGFRRLTREFPRLSLKSLLGATTGVALVLASSIGLDPDVFDPLLGFHPDSSDYASGRIHASLRAPGPTLWPLHFGWFGFGVLACDLVARLAAKRHRRRGA